MWWFAPRRPAQALCLLLPCDSDCRSLFPPVCASSVRVFQLWGFRAFCPAPELSFPLPRLRIFQILFAFSSSFFNFLAFLRWMCFCFSIVGLPLFLFGPLTFVPAPGPRKVFRVFSSLLCVRSTLPSKLAARYFCAIFIFSNIWHNCQYCAARVLRSVVFSTRSCGL
jgi:hypothetical protein